VGGRRERRGATLRRFPLLPRLRPRFDHAAMVTSTGEYQGELHCLTTHGPSANTLATDAPQDNQGRGAAFSPTDLVAAGYVTCIVTTMAIAARKRQVELAGLRYSVTKDMSADTPRRIARLTAHLWLPPAARQLPAGFLENVAHSCPVHYSLASSVEKIIEFHWP
jgi:putative redox protein